MSDVASRSAWRPAGAEGKEAAGVTRRAGATDGDRSCNVVESLSKLRGGVAEPGRRRPTRNPTRVGAPYFSGVLHHRSSQSFLAVGEIAVLLMCYQVGPSATETDLQLVRN